MQNTHVPSEMRERRSSSRASPRTTTIACLRCRQKKKKCDQRLPACGLCTAAGVDCVGYDPVTKRRIPRSYVHDLEDRIATLELKLQQHGINDYDEETNTAIPLGSTTAALPTRTNDSQSETDAQQTLNEVFQMTQRSASAREATFSGALFSKLLELDHASTIVPWSDPSPNPLREEQQILRSVTEGMSSLSNSLPNRRAAEYFAKAYFEYSNFSIPLLHEPTFYKKLDLVYADRLSDSVDADMEPNTQDLKMASYVVNMVFAVGLLALQKHNSLEVPTLLCERYYQTALKALADVGFSNNLEGVQALLLLAKYFYLHPVDFGGWNMIGLALRRAVELGLHKDPVSRSVDPLTLDMMRRTFWVAYSMDRVVSVVLRRPSGLSDGCITAQFPSPVDDKFISAAGIANSQSTMLGKKRYSTHWFRFRRLQSEICTVLHESPPSAYPPVDYNLWQSTMRERIQQWYDQVLQESRPSETGKSIIAPPEVLELTFHFGLVLLYRPSPRIPNPSEDAMIALGSSAAGVITLYRRFYRENKLRLFWQAVEAIYSAGTALLYCYVHCSSIRERFTLRWLEILIHSSLAILWGMAERFPVLKGKRDAFELIASKALAALGEQDSVYNCDTSLPSIILESHLQNPDPENGALETNITADQPIGLSSVITATGDEDYMPTTSINQATLPYPGFDQTSLDWEGLDESNRLSSMTWGWET